MKKITKPRSDAVELAHGREAAHPDLDLLADVDSLADLFTAYRGAAIGSAPRPSVALSARVDLTATPLAMHGDVIASGASTIVATRRAVKGLFGLGVTVAIILGAASAAAAVSMGTAGLLPQGAQDAFDQGAVPGVPAAVTPATVGDAPASEGPSDDKGKGAHSRHVRGTGNSGHNNGIGSAGEDNGFGNAGKHNGISSDDVSDESDDVSDESDDVSDENTGKSDVKHGNSGKNSAGENNSGENSSGENNGGGNSGKDDD